MQQGDGSRAIVLPDGWELAPAIREVIRSVVGMHYWSCAQSMPPPGRGRRGQQWPTLRHGYRWQARPRRARDLQPAQSR